jgi:hypothetical protein
MSGDIPPPPGSDKVERPQIPRGAWRSGVAICLSMIVMGIYTGISPALTLLPFVLALDWATRRRREAATRSKATEGD